MTTYVNRDDNPRKKALKFEFFNGIVALTIPQGEIERLRGHKVIKNNVISPNISFKSNHKLFKALPNLDSIRNNVTLTPLPFDMVLFRKALPEAKDPKLTQYLDSLTPIVLEDMQDNKISDYCAEFTDALIKINEEFALTTENIQKVSKKLFPTLDLEILDIDKYPNPCMLKRFSGAAVSAHDFEKGDFTHKIYINTKHPPSEVIAESVHELTHVFQSISPQEKSIVTIGADLGQLSDASKAFLAVEEVLYSFTQLGKKTKTLKGSHQELKPSPEKPDLHTILNRTDDQLQKLFQKTTNKLLKKDNTLDKMFMMEFFHKRAEGEAQAHQEGFKAFKKVMHTEDQFYPFDIIPDFYNKLSDFYAELEAKTQENNLEYIKNNEDTLMTQGQIEYFQSIGAYL